MSSYWSGVTSLCMPACWWGGTPHIAEVIGFITEVQVCWHCSIHPTSTIWCTFQSRYQKQLKKKKKKKTKDEMISNTKVGETLWLKIIIRCFLITEAGMQAILCNIKTACMLWGSPEQFCLPWKLKVGRIQLYAFQNWKCLCKTSFIAPCFKSITCGKRMYPTAHVSWVCE